MSKVPLHETDAFDEPDRLFQLRQASRTHQQIWLQADAAPSVGIRYRLEVLFPSVQYLAMPFVLRGIQLRRATPEQRDRLTELHNLQLRPDSDIFLLSRDYDHFVVSGTPSWAVADLAYDDDSVFWGHPDHERVVISMGSLR